MADVIWPVGLPQSPLVAQLVETPPTLVVRSTMEAGPAKVRRRATAGVTTFSIELRLTRAQVAILDTFFRDSIMAGALPFEWIHHRTGNQIDYRMVGEPQFRPLHARTAAATEYWAASFTIESMPGTEVVSGDPEPPAPMNRAGGGEGLGGSSAAVAAGEFDENPDEFDLVGALLAMQLPREAVAAPPDVPIDHTALGLALVMQDDDEDGGDLEDGGAGVYTKPGSNPSAGGGGLGGDGEF